MLALALATPVALSPILASPAHAFFGFGRIVYDPSNYAQKRADRRAHARADQQPDPAAQNEAQMLINQARILRACPIRRCSSCSRMSGGRSSCCNRPRASPLTWARSTRRFSSVTGMSCCPRPTSSSSRMRGARWETTVGSCRTPCACRRASSATSTPTAPKCPRWSARARTPPVPAGDAGGQSASGPAIATAVGHDRASVSQWRPRP